MLVAFPCRARPSIVSAGAAGSELALGRHRMRQRYEVADGVVKCNERGGGRGRKKRSGRLGVQYWMELCSWWLRVDRWSYFYTRSVRSNR